MAIAALRVRAGKAVENRGLRDFKIRYRFFLEQNNLAPSTINVRLAAVRRLAYEAADTGLLSPELAAGVRRVKGAKRLGVRIGNWLTIEQSRTLLQKSSSETLRGLRDRAILALLIGCGLRRAELVGLKTEDVQIREEHWVIADLIGKGKNIRTVPVPIWAKTSRRRVDRGRQDQNRPHLSAREQVRRGVG